MRCFLIGMLAVCALVIARRADAAVALVDDFDDGVLGPEWAITFDNTTGWSYTESGTTLHVDSIVAPPRAPNSWGGVILSRATSFPLGDFDIDFDISWTTGSAALQKVLIGLRDGHGNNIAEVGYVDDILAINGDADMRVGSGGWGSYAPVNWGGANSIEFGISRVGDLVEISVYNPNDGQNHLLRSGTADLPLETVDISFWVIVHTLGSVFGEN